MSKALESVITSAMLRAAIRAKIGEGIGRRAVSLLISAYAPLDAGGGRADDTGARRLPVEAIADERRAAFSSYSATSRMRIPRCQARIGMTACWTAQFLVNQFHREYLG